MSSLSLVILGCWLYGLYQGLSQLYDAQISTMIIATMTIAYLYYRFARTPEMPPLPSTTSPQSVASVERLDVGPTLAEKVDLLRADIDKLLAAQANSSSQHSPTDVSEPTTDKSTETPPVLPST